MCLTCHPIMSRTKPVPSQDDCHVQAAQERLPVLAAAVLPICEYGIYTR